MNRYPVYLQKKILSISIALVLLTSSHAQVFRLLKGIDEIEIGIGPNLYNIHYKEESPTDVIFVKPGFTATVNLHYQVRPQIDVSMRLFYDYKGYINKFLTNYYDSTWVNLIGRGEVKAETFLNDVGLALLTKLKVRNTNLYFDAGPFASYFIKGRSERTFSWNNSISKYKMDSDKRFSGGLSFSVGYNIPISNSLGLTLRIIENLNLIDYTHDTITFQIGINFEKL